MSTLPTVSVIIPTFDRPDVLARTLRCFAAQDYPIDRFEVIVVDNSTDETPEVVRSIARESRCAIHLLERPERLPAVKRNIGLASAQGELALFFNDDAWPGATLLQEHAATHAAHAGELVAVLGRVDQSTEMPSTPFLEAYVPFAYHEIADRDGQRVPWDYFWSMNISLRREEMVRRNLVFHEDWAEIGHEDVELGYRWTRAGGVIVYNARARADHFHPHTLASACRLQESVGRGLRDLEVLVPEARLLERYGVLSWRSSPRAIVRGLVRNALFNDATVPPITRWLESRSRNTRLSRWLYWKVLLHHTERGYRTTPRRTPRPLETRGTPVREARA